MPRLFPLFAVTTMLATAAPSIAQNSKRSDAVISGGQVFILVERLLPPTGHFIWSPVPNVSSGESTLDLQYAANMQSQTALLRVFLPDDTFGLSSPDLLKTAPIPDLTGWRTSLAELGEASHQDLISPGRQSDFPIRQDLNQDQVFNIANGTQF